MVGPVWIDDPTVDSMAMLGSFVGFLNQAPDNAELAKHMGLTQVNHRSECMPGPMFPGIIREVPCTEEGCERCTTGRGGYQFRWYDRRWRGGYVRSKRPGTWEPPAEDEGMVAFNVGDLVSAHSLRGAVELNGKTGTVVCAQGERFGLDFGGGIGSKSVRPENLKLVGA
mmetsp:Transcript_2583/g.4410  ORF Transcript_2583/g.4410 Transcript_2583/m.4410 type:complete len:169 (+) Transcript_2583:48-554(+)